MKQVLALLVLLTLTACGTTSEQNHTSYFMVSKGEASGMARMFGAGVDFCKVTQSNLQGVNFVGEISYDGENCTINVTADQ